MKLFLVWFFSLLLAGVIISPFFWLKFLRAKSAVKYLVASSIATLIFLFVYIYPVDTFLSNWTAKTNADLYYFYYDISLNPILISIFLIIISPFIFTKISHIKFSLRSFLLNLFLSALIFSSIFLYWAYVLLPKAFQDLHNHF